MAMLSVQLNTAVFTGIDVVFDPVGGVPFMEALKTLKWGGQIAIIGFASGTIPKVRYTHSRFCTAHANCLTKVSVWV